MTLFREEKKMKTYLYAILAALVLLPGSSILYGDLSRNGVTSDEAPSFLMTDHHLSSTSGVGNG